MKRNSLNQAYRLVWNHARGCWMAVAETCRSRGKSGRSGGVVAAAVVAALGALGGQAAMAQLSDSCDDPSGATSIVAGSSNMCSLGGNESVNVISTGAIATSSTPAVTITGTLNSVTNAGSIASTSTSAIQNVGTAGSILNTGSVSAPAGSAIHNATISSVISSISNSGTLGGSVGVQNVGSIAGITNASTGQILANASGVSSSGNIGTLSNLGNITAGSGAGVLVLAAHLPRLSTVAPCKAWVVTPWVLPCSIPVSPAPFRTLARLLVTAMAWWRAKTAASTASPIPT